MKRRKSTRLTRTKLNPLGVVPTLIENERPMIESLGIGLYLADKHADATCACARFTASGGILPVDAFSVASLDLHAERNRAVKALPDSPEKI